MLHREKSSGIFLTAGCILLALTFVPFLILGENAVFTYHDQLDGELIAYMLQAKHMGDGSILPEFLGGASKTALIPPAPACVLLFCFFQPLTALLLMQIVGSFAGYLGMFLLVRKCTESNVAALAAGLLYGIMPFLPVYGLSQYGLPLLLWCLIRMRQSVGNDLPESALPVFGYGILYALNSSLVLVGFAVLISMAVWIVWDWRRRRRLPGREGSLWLTMAGIYLLTNSSLLMQVFGMGEKEISHKTEYVLAPTSFFQGILQAFLYGGQHSADHHVGILLLAVVIFAVDTVRTRRSKNVRESLSLCGGPVKVMKLCLISLILFAGISAVWNSNAGIAVRGHMGAAGAFQMDRFLWLSPCLWYLILGCSVAYVWKMFWEIAVNRQMSGESAIICKAVSWVMVLVCVLVLGGTGFALLKDSDVKSNLQKLRNPDYPMMSFREYYAVGVLDQVADYLREEKGLSKEEYRIVSLGIDPAAALYHGFYCLDGYSNNYSLAYKHAFRRVIAPALEQSEYLRAYFDEWGNRCYLFGTESPGYYTIEKNGFYFQHLEMDTKALRELGGEYLFSAAYIANSEELGLVLMREEAFETADSYYRIFLYEVTDGEQ